MRKLILGLSIIVVIIGFLIYGSNKYSEPIVLSIPSCNIRVNCEYVINPTSENLQKVIDKSDYAAWYDDYIMDHAGQNFRGLWNIQEGDTVTLGVRQYKCSFITSGWSDRGIRFKSDNHPRADLYLCTCIPGGRSYEIYIVGITTE